MQEKIKRIFKKVIQITIILFVTATLFELVYRWYLIDFYKNSFCYLNNEKDLKAEKVDYLFFGDSFSAAKDSYVDFIKKDFSKSKVVNFSVSGIGIKQVNLYAKRKIEKYNPDIIIYQVYVGNDLIDIQNLSNWSRLSFMRNGYWFTSDYYLSLRYLNQNLSFFRTKNFNTDLHLDHSFSIESYNMREKMLFVADASYLEKTINIEADFKMRYDKWKKELTAFLQSISQDKKVFIVFIPHCSQLNPFYYNNMKQIGAHFNSFNAISELNYPFFDKAQKDFNNYPNVTFLNPLAYLRARDHTNYRLFYENDPHFNLNGHYELAQFLSKEITK